MLSLSAAPALSAPTIVEATAVSGASAKVTWKNTGGPLLAMSIRLNMAADGSTTGAWLTLMQGPTAPGQHVISMDLRGLVADGRHAVSLVAQDATGTTTMLTTEPLIVDASGPLVERPAVVAPSATGWLGVQARAHDPESGLDLAQPTLVEVAPWSPEKSAAAGPWRLLGHLATGPEGVGVDASTLPDGEYVARVTLVNGAGLLGRSGWTWFAKVPPNVAAPEAPPSRLLLRLSSASSFSTTVRRRAIAKNRPLAFAVLLRGPGDEVLAGYRVSVRMADGRGFVLTTDALGVARFRQPVTHGGIVRIRASRRLSTGLSVVAKDLNITIAKASS